MSATNPASDPLAFGRQLWQQWNDTLQSAMPQGKATLPDWSAAMRQWSELAGGGSLDASRAAEKLGAHGEQFFGMMQQLLQRAGANASVGDLGTLWRQQIADGNPMLDALRQVSAEGARGWEQFVESAKVAAAPASEGLLSTLALPGFGLGRERQAQLAELVSAQAAQLEAAQAYQRLLLKASEAGMERFETKLGEHSEPGRQIGSMRALYDLWIDAAEEAYAEVALSPAFRKAYADLVNTQMRSRQLQQREVSRAARELGMPTREELDGVLTRLHQLQRDLRTLRSQLASRPIAAAPRSEPSTASASKRQRKPAAGSRKAASKRPAKASKPRPAKPADAGVAAAKTPKRKSGTAMPTVAKPALGVAATPKSGRSVGKRASKSARSR